MKQSVILMRANRKRQEEADNTNRYRQEMTMFRCVRCDVDAAYPDNSERCALCGGFTLKACR